MSNTPDAKKTPGRISNLRAMFEQGNSSPSSSGGNAATPESVKPKPLGKIKTSFVAIPGAQGIGLQKVDSPKFEKQKSGDTEVKATSKDNQTKETTIPNKEETKSDPLEAQSTVVEDAITKSKSTQAEETTLDATTNFEAAPGPEPVIVETPSLKKHEEDKEKEPEAPPEDIPPPADVPSEALDIPTEEKSEDPLIDSSKQDKHLQNNDEHQQFGGGEKIELVGRKTPEPSETLHTAESETGDDQVKILPAEADPSSSHSKEPLEVTKELEPAHVPVLQQEKETVPDVEEVATLSAAKPEGTPKKDTTVDKEDSKLAEEPVKAIPAKKGKKGKKGYKAKVQKDEPALQKDESAPHINEPVAPQIDEPAPEKDEPVPQKDEPTPPQDELASQKDEPTFQKDEPAFQKDEPAPQSNELTPQKDEPSPRMEQATPVITHLEQETPHVSGSSEKHINLPMVSSGAIENETKKDEQNTSPVLQDVSEELNPDIEDKPEPASISSAKSVPEVEAKPEHEREPTPEAEAELIPESTTEEVKPAESALNLQEPVDAVVPEDVEKEIVNAANHDIDAQKVAQETAPESASHVTEISTLEPVSEQVKPELPDSEDQDEAPTKPTEVEETQQEEETKAVDPETKTHSVASSVKKVTSTTTRPVAKPVSTKPSEKKTAKPIVPPTAPKPAVPKQATAEVRTTKPPVPKAPVAVAPKKPVEALSTKPVKTQAKVESKPASSSSQPKPVKEPPVPISTEPTIEATPPTPTVAISDAASMPPPPSPSTKFRPSHSRNSSVNKVEPVAKSSKPRPHSAYSATSASAAKTLTTKEAKAANTGRSPSRAGQAPNPGRSPSRAGQLQHSAVMRPSSRASRSAHSSPTRQEYRAPSRTSQIAEVTSLSSKTTKPIDNSLLARLSRPTASSASKQVDKSTIVHVAPHLPKKPIIVQKKKSMRNNGDSGSNQSDEGEDHERSTSQLEYHNEDAAMRDTNIDDGNNEEVAA